MHACMHFASIVLYCRAALFFTASSRFLLIPPPIPAPPPPPPQSRPPPKTHRHRDRLLSGPLARSLAHSPCDYLLDLVQGSPAPANTGEVLRERVGPALGRVALGGQSHHLFGFTLGVGGGCPESKAAPQREREGWVGREREGWVRWGRVLVDHACTEKAGLLCPKMWAVVAAKPHSCPLLLLVVVSAIRIGCKQVTETTRGKPQRSNARQSERMMMMMMEQPRENTSFNLPLPREIRQASHQHQHQH